VDILDKIVSDKNYTLNIHISTSQRDGTHFKSDGNNGKIYFSPNSQVGFYDNMDDEHSQDINKLKFNSPSSLLGHEMGHAYNRYTDAVGYSKRRLQRSTLTRQELRGGEAFYNKEEEYTTLTIQNSINDKLKQPKRVNYGKEYWYISDPTKTGIGN
jgi:hypothetical protein